MNNYVVSYLIGKDKYYKKIVLAETDFQAREKVYIELTGKGISNFQITDVKRKGN